MAEKKKMKLGFFSMSDVNKVVKAKSHIEAKEIAFAAIDAQPNAKENNIKKAKHMVIKSKDKIHLAQCMTNFLLAHPSEDLGMNKQ